MLAVYEFPNAGSAVISCKTNDGWVHNHTALYAPPWHSSTQKYATHKSYALVAQDRTKVLLI